MGMPQSQKQERDQLSLSLRAQGKSWVEIAAVFRERYRINPRLAFRLVHGWSQAQVVDQWNARWPDEPKTFKSISYWELWPGGTGHAPSFHALDNLAQLYQCSVADLLADLPDYRHRDDALCVAARAPGDEPIATASTALPANLLGELVVHRSSLSPLTVLADPIELTLRLQAANLDELTQVVLMWIQQRLPCLSRRELLAKLSSAFTIAAAAPLFDGLTPDEQAHVAQVMQDPGGFDEPTLRYCEEIVTNLRRQGDVLGPQLTLQTVVGLRHIAQRLAEVSPPGFKQRAVSSYAELTQLTGWLCFNMGDYRSAEKYYDEARSAAHDAENVELATYILCTMSHLATWRGKPRVGLDHAVAAAALAQRTSPLAGAYAADVAVRAYVADNQPAKCRETLDREYSLLTAVSPDATVSSWWYFYGKSFYWSTHGQCSLKLHEPEDALRALDESLTLIDQANLHEYTFRQLFRAEARIQQGEIDQAVGMIADAAHRSTVNSSERITQSVGRLRSLLTPWEKTPAVRDLDAQLMAYRPELAKGSGRT
jgi:hypothetical protein